MPNRAPETREQELVDQFRFKPARWVATRELLGPRRPQAEARGTSLPAPVVDALRWGLGHWSPPVRRVCLEILDTHPDPEAVPLIVALLDDPVPRVRWHAVHALSCEGCKAGVSVLTPEIEDRIRTLAEADSNRRVRDQARLSVGGSASGEALL